MPLLRKQAIKLLDRGDGAAADWPLIAEAALKVAFDALDQMPNDPRTLSLLRRVHSGAENRITQNPAYEREAFEATSAPAWARPDQASPSYAPDSPTDP